MSALKSTEVFFIHSHHRKKNVLRFVLLSYFSVVLVYAGLRTWVFRVVAVPVEIAQRTIPYYTRKASSSSALAEKQQRAVVFSSLYGMRFGSRVLALPFHKKFKRGDVVLVATNKQRGLIETTSTYRNFLNKVQNMFSLFTFNVIKPATRYSIMRIVATEYERVFYSGTTIYKGDASRVIVSDDDILPYIDTDNVLTVPYDHVFLTSDVPYGLDSRYHGAYRSSDILGKVGFLIGPVWGRVSFQ